MLRKFKDRFHDRHKYERKAKPVRLTSAQTLNAEESLQCLESLRIDLSPASIVPIESIYAPLPPGHIRLLHLRIDPAHPGVPLCSMTTTSWEQAIPQGYYAVSYTWLETEYLWYGLLIPETTKMTVNNMTVEISGIVAHILGLLNRFGLKFIWIDALCINQADAAEKSRQVAQMGAVYACALEVIVVLGKPSLETDRKLVGRTGEEVVRKGEKALICHAYWTRSWILQELASAKGHRILCGNYLLNAHESFRFVSAICYQVGEQNGWQLFFRTVEKLILGRKLEVLQILDATRLCKCSDARDVIYSKIALTTQPDIIGFPDYTLTLEEVFIGFAKRHVEMTGTLEILQHVYGARRHPCLPSWVSDWLGISTFKDFSHLVQVFDDEDEDIPFCKAYVEAVSERISDLIVWGIVQETRHLEGMLTDNRDITLAETPPGSIHQDHRLLCRLRSGPTVATVVMTPVNDHYVLVNLYESPKIATWATAVNDKLWDQVPALERCRPFRIR